MITAYFLVLASGKEVFMPSPPDDLELDDQEQVVSRQVSEDEYDRLIDNQDKHFRVYSQVEGAVLSPFAPPTEINYRLLSLHRNEILNRGLRVGVDYYAKSDGTTFSDIVLRERHEYAWVPYRAIPKYRDVIIEWMLNDGSMGFTKTKRRYFTITQGSKLHQKRKAANVGALKETLLGLFIRESIRAGGTLEQGYARVTAMFSDMFIAVQTYEQAQEGPLLEMVATHPESILDAPMSAFDGSPTIREYLIDQLTIPVYVPE